MDTPAKKPLIVLYNCKRCKIGRRVEYPFQFNYSGALYRHDQAGNPVKPGVWIQSSGGGRPPEYGGDPLGLCPTCGQGMTYAELKARLVPEQKCDARCTGARGPSCDCSCGGKNHGSAWSGTPQVSEAPPVERTEAGAQFVAPGMIGREIPRGALKAKRNQAEELGPLFSGPEEEERKLL